MESDLISRSAVLEVAMRYLPDDDGSCSNANEDPRNMLDDIECIPAIDAVPVVRCRECCYLAKDLKSLYCTYHDNINVTEEFFCETGEVKHADARKPV